MNFTTINFIVFIIGISLFIVNWIVNTDFSIISNTVSQYAYGKYGFLTTIGFVLIGAGSLLLALYLFSTAENLLYQVIVSIIFAYGIFIGSLSIFRCDQPGKTTFRGTMHNILAITGLVSLSVAMLLFLVLGAKQNNLSVITIIFSLTNITSLLLLQFASDKYRGIWERGAMFSQYFWLIFLLCSN
jgi:hypothetical protein